MVDDVVVSPMTAVMTMSIAMNSLFNIKWWAVACVDQSSRKQAG